MKPVNIHEAKTHACRPVKIGGLKCTAPVPEDFNTMFESDIEALFAGAPMALITIDQRLAAYPGTIEVV